MLGYFVNTEAIARHIGKYNPELCSKILVIDFNIEKHQTIKKHGLEVAYSDISNLTNAILDALDQSAVQTNI